MALIQCDFFSESLGFSTSMNVILPQPARERYRVLYLLHGMSDDHTIWCRRTSIERYVDPLGLAVVMPAVHRGYYTDMAAGYRYWTFISEELPALARSFFPLSHKREDTFVAGLSMGGYGAFKLALRSQRALPPRPVSPVRWILPHRVTSPRKSGARRWSASSGLWIN